LSREISPSTYRTAYGPFTPSNSEQRLPPTYYRGCWHVVSRGFFYGYRQALAGGSSPSKGVYTPRGFILHAASLRQAFAHCAIFPTAASRRSLGRVSVPVWPVVLSDRLPVSALVSRYLTNKLIGRGPLRERPCGLSGPGPKSRTAYAVLAPVSRGCSTLSGRLSTRYAPVRHASPLVLLQKVQRSTCMC
jgi:hypothetical protein